MTSPKNNQKNASLEIKHELSLNPLSSTDHTSNEAGKTTDTEKADKKEFTIEEIKQNPNELPKPTHTDIRKEFDDAFASLKHNYTEHKLEDAVDQLNILRGIQKSDGLQHDFKIHIESIFKENQEFFTTIDEEMKELNFMLHQMQDEEGWNLEKVKKRFHCEIQEKCQ